jgi:ribosome-associated protein
MDLRQKQRAVVDALEDIKGHDIVVYNTAALPTMFERVVIASGDSTRQVKALADHVQEKLEALGARVYGVEGAASSEWVLVDFGDLVVHVMHPTVRSFYNLEEIWGGKDVKMAPPKKPAAKTGRAKKPAKKAAGKPAVRKAPAARAKAARPGRSR